MARREAGKRYWVFLDRSLHQVHYTKVSPVNTQHTGTVLWRILYSFEEENENACCISILVVFFGLCVSYTSNVVDISCSSSPPLPKVRNMTMSRHKLPVMNTVCLLVLVGRRTIGRMSSPPGSLGRALTRRMRTWPGVPISRSRLKRLGLSSRSTCLLRLDQSWWVQEVGYSAFILFCVVESLEREMTGGDEVDLYKSFIYRKMHKWLVLFSPRVWHRWHRRTDVQSQ